MFFGKPQRCLLAALIIFGHNPANSYSLVLVFGLSYAHRLLAVAQIIAQWYRSSNPTRFRNCLTILYQTAMFN